MIAPDETIAAEEVATSCFICQKDLSGKLVPTARLTDLTDLLVAEKIATVGTACDHCGTRYCESHKKQLHNSLLQGFLKSTCLKCGQIIGGSQRIVQLRHAKDYSELPQLMQLLGEMKLAREHTGAITANTAGTSAQLTYPADACPICGGTKISVTKIPAGSIKDRLFELIFGGGVLLLLFIVTRLEGPLKISASVSGILTALGLWVALELFWEGLTNHPLPVVGLRLFSSPKFETRATCEGCRFTWQVSQQAKP